MRKQSLTHAIPHHIRREITSRGKAPVISALGVPKQSSLGLQRLGQPRVMLQ